MSNYTMSAEMGANVTRLMGGFRQAIGGILKLKNAAKGLNLTREMGLDGAGEKISNLTRQLEINAQKIDALREKADKLRKTIAEPPNVDTSRAQSELAAIDTKIEGYLSKIKDYQAEIARIQSKPATGAMQVKADAQEIKRLEGEIHKLEGAMDRAGEKAVKFQDTLTNVKVDTAAAESAKQELLRTEGQILQLEKSSLSAKSQIQKLESSLQKVGEAGNSATSKASSGMSRLKDTAEAAGRTVSKPFNAIGKVIAQATRRIFIMGAAYKAIRAASSYLMGALKTNTQFAASLNAIKVNLMTAFQPIYEYILPAINQLMELLAKATGAIAGFVSALFGKTYKQSQQAAQQINAATQATDGYSDAMKKANQQTAGFDKFNDITPTESGGGSGSSTNQNTLDFSSVEPPDMSWIDKLMAKLKPLADAFKPVWEQIKILGGHVWEGLKWAYENILLPLGKWAIETVLPKVFDAFAAALKVVNAIIEAFKPLALWLWETFLKPLAEWTGGVIVEVLGWITERLEGLAEWINNNQKLIETLAIIVGAFAAAWFLVSTAMTVANTVMTLWNAIGAISAIVTTAFGAAVAFLTSPIGIVVLAIGALIAVAVLLARNWDTVSAWGKKAWETIKNAWNIASAWFNEKVVAPLKKFFSELWANISTWAKNAWTTISEAFRNAGTWFSTNIITPIKNFFSNLWANISTWAKEAWSKIVDAFKTAGTWFSEKVITPVKDFFKNLWDGLKNGAKACWEGITGFFSGLSTWFNDKIVQPIAKFFGNLWGGIKSGAGKLADWIKTKVIDPIVNAFKKMYNGVAGVVEGMINGFIGIINKFIGGINSVIKTINNIPGVNLGQIGTLGKVSIPRLANGGAAFGEVAAIIGDNHNARQDPELAAPQSFIQDAVLQALLQRDIAGGGSTGEIVIKMLMSDGTVLADMLIDPMNKTAKNRGFQPVFKPATT